MKSSAVCAGDFLLRNTAAKLDGDLVIQYLPQYEIAVSRERERDLFNRSKREEWEWRGETKCNLEPEQQLSWPTDSAERACFAVSRVINTDTATGATATTAD